MCERDWKANPSTLSGTGQLQLKALKVTAPPSVVNQCLFCIFSFNVEAMMLTASLNHLMFLRCVCEAGLPVCSNVPLHIFTFTLEQQLQGA